jgi:hypothetical protein
LGACLAQAGQTPAPKVILGGAGVSPGQDRLRSAPHQGFFNEKASLAAGVAFSFLQNVQFLICFLYQVEKRIGSFMKFKLSRHAKQEMDRRAISMDLLESVLEAPQQVIEQPDGKRVYQSQMDFGNGEIFLLRVVVVEFADYALVVTVYRTKKIGKYWRIS